MKFHGTLALVLGGMVFLTSHEALAVIIFLKGADVPIRGYLKRENEHVVVVDQLLPNGTTQERTISRSDIDDLIQTVSAERLAALQRDNPDGYREYAEELAEKRKDPDAHVTAIRLFLIAAHLAPARLGRSCLLGMVPLARGEGEQRRFRAMAYLLDPAHDPQLLTVPVPTSVRASDLEPRQAEGLLRALRLLRQGMRREAQLQARRGKLEERLSTLTNAITYAEFEQGCEPVCPHCQKGRQTCPECGGRKFVSGRSCAACGASGEVTCAYCGGDYRSNPLPPSLLKRIVQLELDWLPAEKPTAAPPRPSRPSWSQSVQQGQFAPLPPLALETLTEFDPRQHTFRDGEWTS